ncbi:arsenate reductase ArsC [Nitriliruptoraceae bacterium ZYF776]|nr:arsenate reductase ArsC [Profundirhabdus halotolerans]
MTETGASTVERRQQLAPVAQRLHRDFAGTFGEETIERLLVDSYDRLHATARYDSYLPLLVERFARERLTAAARSRGLLVTDTPTVLFLCVHNAGRSQMAAGFTQALGGDRIQVLSGGSAPAEQVNPAAVEAMAEVGIDISASYPKPWTEETLEATDVVITMGCGDACPVLPGKRYLDWELDDPAGKGVEAVRPIRDEIERRVRGLLEELGVEAATATA